MGSEIATTCQPIKYGMSLAAPILSPGGNTLAVEWQNSARHDFSLGTSTKTIAIHSIQSRSKTYGTSSKLSQPQPHCNPR